MSTNGIGPKPGSRQPDIGGGRLQFQILPAIGTLAIIVILAVFGLARLGCANHHTPPGHEGYVKSQPLIGAGEFVGTQTGPTSTGWVWRQKVVNIDIRQRTYSEDMVILTSNRLELSFRAHARIKLKKGHVRQVIEALGGANWYRDNVQKQFRAAVRDEVQKLEPFEVKNLMRQIGDNVLVTMKGKYADTPIEFLTVDIGNIEYPEVVVRSVIRKFVTNEDNERKDVELAIAQRQIDIGIAEAQGIADAQQIIRTTLDPMFLQFEALRAIEALAESPNTTFLVMPFSKEGQAPVIMNLSASPSTPPARSNR